VKAVFADTFYWAALTSTQDMAHVYRARDNATASRIAFRCSRAPGSSRKVSGPCSGIPDTASAASSLSPSAHRRLHHLRELIHVDLLREARVGQLIAVAAQPLP
jgi:hypothetical protein